MKKVIVVFAVIFAVVLSSCNCTDGKKADKDNVKSEVVAKKELEKKECAVDCEKECCAKKKECAADCEKPCCAEKKECAADCEKECCADKKTT